MQWIDIHTHLDGLEISPREAVEAARRDGVRKMITIGTAPDDHTFVMQTVDEFPEVVYGALGVHPHEAERMSDEVGRFMLENGRHPSIVAIGEIGLDHYYKNADAATQERAFITQLELAEQLALPVEIHTRDAEKETIGILKKFDGRVRGVIHCFTGTQWLADEALALGFHISISGIVTFKNAQTLRDTVKTIPINCLHVETDAPFLTPAPHRGQKNVPAFVVHTAHFVSELKQQEISSFAQQMTANAEAMFPKLREIRSG